MHLAVEDSFIELGRTFRELRSTGKVDDDSDVLARLFGRSPLNWERLLHEHRLIILSEAGSGKTAEIRNIAHTLRREGKAAFFLRLEHVTSDFAEAFEEGTNEEFQQWLRSNDEGWLLLDSIDEARLRSPADFERALRKVSVRIRSAMQRTHLVITGRTTAWRPKTDLALCKDQFPFSRSVREATGIELDEVGDPDAVVVEEETGDKERPPFLIVALDELAPHQIRRFAEGKKVKDIDGLLNAIERADAYTFTARPQDLGEIIEFWEDHGRIGTRLELMRNSIARRLMERDQNRAEVKSMDATRARAGAVRVAGATTMAQEQTIRVPDGAENREGLPITRILPDWNEQDCSTLLSHPIFDEAV